MGRGAGPGTPVHITRLSVKDRPAQQRLEVTVTPFRAEENDDDLDPFRASVRASLARGIQVTAFWSPRTAGHPLAAMYVVAPAGPALRVHLPPARELSDNWTALNDLHTECLSNGRTMVVPLTHENLEVHLVAVKDSPEALAQWKPNGTAASANSLDTTPTEPLCCFWGFLCPVGAPILYRPLLEAERLVVVLDLDETLVQALTLSGFSERLEAINKDIEREELPAMRLAYEADKRRLESDFAQLHEFSEHDRVTLASGEVVNAALEERSGREPRPVLRLPSSDGFGAGASAPGMAEAAAEAATRPEGWGGERIFTRVHPEHRGTSMLIHVQSGWTAMKAALLAKHPARAGGRYEIYVCTLSEPTYAGEIWSLLDPAAQLIADQSKRIVCVPPSQKKSLATMLAGRAPQHLAVIVDDRPGIWVDEDRKQLLPVAAFHPYRRSVLHKETTIASLERIAEALRRTHNGFYYDLRKTFEPAMMKATSSTTLASLPLPPSAHKSLRAARLKASAEKRAENQAKAAMAAAAAPAVPPPGVPAASAGAREEGDLEEGELEDGELEEEDEPEDDLPEWTGGGPAAEALPEWMGGAADGNPPLLDPRRMPPAIDPRRKPPPPGAPGGPPSVPPPAWVQASAGAVGGGGGPPPRGPPPPGLPAPNMRNMPAWLHDANGGGAEPSMLAWPPGHPTFRGPPPGGAPPPIGMPAAGARMGGGVFPPGKPPPLGPPPGQPGGPPAGAPPPGAKPPPPGLPPNQVDDNTPTDPRARRKEPTANTAAAAAAVAGTEIAEAATDPRRARAEAAGGGASGSGRTGGAPPALPPFSSQAPPPAGPPPAGPPPNGPPPAGPPPPVAAPNGMGLPAVPAVAPPSRRGITCKYGARCKRGDCYFEHPEGRAMDGNLGVGGGGGPMGGAPMGRMGGPAPMGGPHHPGMMAGPGPMFGMLPPNMMPQAAMGMRMGMAGPMGMGPVAGPMGMGHGPGMGMQGPPPQHMEIRLMGGGGGGGAGGGGGGAITAHKRPRLVASSDGGGGRNNGGGGGGGGEKGAPNAADVAAWALSNDAFADPRRNGNKRKEM